VVEANVHVILNGTVGVHLSTVAGPMILKGLPLSTMLALQTWNGLRDVKLTVTSQIVSGGLPNAVVADSTMSLVNPVPLGLDLGDSVAHLQIWYTMPNGTEVVIGYTDMSQFRLLSGNNILNETVYLTRSAQYPGLLEQLLAGYLAGNNTQITVVGRPHQATAYPYLDKAFAAMRLPTFIPGLKTALITHAQVRVGLGIIFDQIPTKLTIHNVFNVAIEIISANTLIYYNDTKEGYELIAQLVKPFKPVVVPAQTLQMSNELPIETISDTAKGVFQAFLAASTGGVPLDVVGYLGFAIQQFNATIYYSQKNINTETCSISCK